jgi:hypothetical protein
MGKSSQRRLNADEQYESNKFIEKYLQDIPEKKRSWSVLASMLNKAFKYDEYVFQSKNVGKIARRMIKNGGKAPERNCRGVAKQNKEACELDINFWFFSRF